jgi:hypothetical protein
MKICPKEKRKKEKINKFNLFDFTKMQKKKRKILFLKWHGGNCTLFQNFQEEFLKIAKNQKKRFTDSALIIQERDFSHL